MSARPSQANTVAGIVFDGSRSWPDHVAIKFPDFEWTFQDLEREASSIARGLVALGVNRGDHVGLLLPNGGDFVRTYFGVAMASAVAVTLNVRYRKSDLDYVLRKSDIRVLVLTADFREHYDFEALLVELIDQGQYPLLRHVVVLGTSDAGRFVSESALERMAERFIEIDLGLRAANVRLSDPATMLFTSGTTAFPKGCVLSHEAVVRTAFAWSQQGIEMGAGDTVWIPNPLFHIGALTTLVASVAVGARFMSLPYFDPDLAVESLIGERVDVFFPVFDSVAMAILDHPRSAEIDFSQTRYVFTIGNPKNIERIRRTIPHAQHLNAYGMTETAGWCVLNFDVSEVGGPLGGGRPVPGVEFRLEPLDDDLDLGEICIRSWCTITEYYDEPEATARSFDDDGWFHTGDVGQRRPDGSLRFRGRNGEFMKVGGENVSAMEIEYFLGAHNDIRHVAVVAVPDVRLGEVPAVFIETVPGVELSEADVLDYCRDRIASFKRPRYVRFVKESEWPMSATKIRKGDLRKRLIVELNRASEAIFMVEAGAEADAERMVNDESV